MSPVLDDLNFESSPDHTTISRWEHKYDREELRDLLRLSAEQVGWTGVGAIGASGFQHDQTSYRYRNRANFSFHSMKTMILVDAEPLTIRDVHFPTQKAYDGHIGMQVYRQSLAASSLSLDVSARGFAVTECLPCGSGRITIHTDSMILCPVKISAYSDQPSRFHCVQNTVYQ